MKAAIYIRSSKDPVVSSENFETIQKRLFDSMVFMKVTVEGMGTVFISKPDIVLIEPYEKKTK